MDRDHFHSWFADEKTDTERLGHRRSRDNLIAELTLNSAILIL